MRVSKNLVLALASVSVLYTSCKKDDHEHDHGGDDNKEYRFVRVLVSDVNDKKITQINPNDGTQISFDARFPNATLYSTYNSRFAALLYGNDNFTEFFDSGLEYHGDHVDVKGTAKFAAITANGSKPTHFKSKGNESLIFNDGDGTLSIASESEFHVANAKMRTINAGLDAHHGAMAQFDNGNIAVTQLDKASTLSGPHAVKIINSNGATVHNATLAVSRLHGNASDGKNAVFGVDGGILVVNENGTQKIVPNPGDFGTVRLGTILYATKTKKFIGYAANKGAYFIDLSANKLTPIVTGTDFIQCKVDKSGSSLLTLTLDGTLSIYNLADGSLIKSGKVIPASVSTDTYKPVVEATDKFVYAVVPSAGEVLQIKRNDFGNVSKIKVTALPSKIAILGHETDESH
ncbi:hypothetical protein [Polluticaenibacter yanchengensis]|uniref:Uncharacterized protein n=1 Tax=Polluticaenibacter yanchengensis TaxID=3014562 RepID=A0ABT4UJF3_9BACT|nr:hypothetical protein [Chitinophagaceae bacterium LY-5]